MDKLESCVFYNVSEWIEENKRYFTLPVANKLMHGDGQISVMFVGGPNERQDYHIESGEELFLQLKGDMVLKVVERGQHKDVVIREGQIFLLPRAIPHSPQRTADTIGLVLERERHSDELDVLRFYAEVDGEPTVETLYEISAHWGQLANAMATAFQEFFNSEQCKTGKAIPGSLPPSPIEVDSETRLHDPFSLENWIELNSETINSCGKLAVFDTDHQLQVFVFGQGENSDRSEGAQVWIWQMKGKSEVTLKDETHKLKQDDSLLIPVGRSFTVCQEMGSLALVCSQDSGKMGSLALVCSQDSRNG